jgi:putative Holliday junction resolvase
VPKTLEDIATHLGSGPFLGMDWGKRRVGLAISDADNQVAMPLCVVDAGGALRTTLITLWEERKIKALVMGWPLHADYGKESDLCPAISRLGHRLVDDHGWPICFWDERFSSQAVLHFPQKKGTELHHHAAAFILQGALHRWQHLRSLIGT